MLQVRVAAQRGAAARGRALRRSGRARAVVLGTLSGTGWCRRALSRHGANPRCDTIRALHTCTDSLDRRHANSESARFKVIVLR